MKRYYFSVLACLAIGCADDSSGGESTGADAELIDAAHTDAGSEQGDALPSADSAADDSDGAAPDASSAADGGTPYTATLNLPAEPPNYANPAIPAHFEVETQGMHGQRPVVDEDNTPADNPNTDLGATLGRVLFYDTNLSANRTIACASCHKAEFGFSDDRVLSKGFENGDTGRHSMGLTNARFYGEGRFFWDQRAATLEDQVLMPFQDPVEMGMTLDGLVQRVQDGEYYPALFESAFGDPMIDATRISRALAQFVRSLVSTGSKYDEGRAMVDSRSAPFPNFSDAENLGKQLFVSPPPQGGLGCFVCHQGEAFIAQEATNNGLDAENEDLGYGGVTGSGRDEGKFKVPSLRNVAQRAPYMHDGRFATLEAVIEHYSTGVQPNPSLGSPFFVRNGQVPQLNLTPEHKAALLAFLNTLSDEQMLNDPKFADPFVRD